MNNHRRPTAGLYMLLLPLVLAGGLWAAEPASDSKATALYDYADEFTRLVQNQRIEELAKLSIPDTTPASSKLDKWKKSYVSHMEKSAEERDKEYNDAVKKAQDYLQHKKYDEAMFSVVTAYQIARNQQAFLQQDWVKNLTAKVAQQAATYEKNGQWIESLQLYTDLNSLYEIDVRYKPDMQRLARRTRLLAMYTPKTFYDMRKALLEKQEKERAAENKDQPTTKPAEDDTQPSFSRWQDMVDNVHEDMGVESIELARHAWVEPTSYDTLVKGGIEALRLFLTTPELATEFPGLKDPAARQAFGKALDGALARDSSGKDLTGADVDQIISSLIAASNESIKLPKQVITMEFTDGAMEKLDPFTAVIWPHELDEFDKNTRGSFGGVGIMINMKDGNLQVISPLEDSPAFKAGIQADDIITAINGKSAFNISIDQAVHSIMGKPGTPVTLRIKRGKQPEKDYTLTRDIIRVSSVKGYERDPSDHSKWNFMLDNDNKIGYIRITQFQEDTADELQNALVELQKQGMRGLILDLRFNPGGLLKAAVDISDMFLQDGVILSTRGRAQKESKWIAHRDTVVPMNMPMVVLVNQYSASASEIFSGAMRDLHRALIVGHRSFGKGSVQNLLPIGSERQPDGAPEAEMKLTEAYYYLPNGESLHRRDGKTTWGVDPDVVVDLTPDQLANLLKQRRDSDVIHTAGDPATDPAATAPNASADTQLDTALLMMRLQLVQANPS